MTGSAGQAGPQPGADAGHGVVGPGHGAGGDLEDGLHLGEDVEAHVDAGGPGQS